MIPHTLTTRYSDRRLLEMALRRRQASIKRIDPDEGVNLYWPEFGVYGCGSSYGEALSSLHHQVLARYDELAEINYGVPMETGLWRKMRTLISKQRDRFALAD